MTGLSERVLSAVKHALAAGALQPIRTRVETVREGGVEFTVRVVANLARKQHALRREGHAAPRNPFLPYDPDLYVADLSGTQVLLLNKYSVMERHALITRRWMMAVPRRRASCEGISVNALGFAGALLVKSAAELERLKQLGPLKVLQGVCFPLSAALPARAENHA